MNNKLLLIAAAFAGISGLWPAIDARVTSILTAEGRSRLGRTMGQMKEGQNSPPSD